MCVSLHMWTHECVHVPVHMDIGVCIHTHHREQYVQQVETAALVPSSPVGVSLLHCARLPIAVPKGLQNLGFANSVFIGFQSLNCCSANFPACFRI